MQEITNRGSTFCAVKVTLAAGTTTTISTTGTTHYCIGGKAYTKAAQTNLATPTTDATTGAAFVGIEKNEGSVFVVGYNANGDLKVAQGTVTDLDAGGKFVQVPEFPALPEDFCAIAYMTVLVGSTGSTWTFGSSNQASATGVTYNRQDVMTLPQRPQAA